MKINKLHLNYCLLYEHLTNNKNALNLLNINILAILYAVAKKVKIKNGQICAYYYIIIYYIILYHIPLYYYTILFYYYLLLSIILYYTK